MRDQIVEDAKKEAEQIVSSAKKETGELKSNTESELKLFASQAAEALKLIMGVGVSLAGRLLLLDGLHMEWSSMRVARDPGCAVCGVVVLPL